MDFTDKEIITMVTTLLSPIADQGCDALQRSDIRPHIAGETGCWVDPKVPGDDRAPAEDYIGIAFFMKDAEDADTKQPFRVALKVHKPSFKADPKQYCMGMVASMATAIGKMQDAMDDTQQARAKRMKAELEYRSRHIGH